MSRSLGFSLLFLPLLLGACAASDVPEARQPSPYVDALKDARNVGAATDGATRDLERAIKAVQP